MARAGRRTRTLVRTLFIAFGVAGLLAGPFVDPAAAADNGTWAVEPSSVEGQAARDWFVYTLNPGQSLIDTVSIENMSAEAITFEIYPTDAYNTTPDAAFALLKEGDVPTDVGSWIKFEVTEYTVPPQTRAEIPFQITVPLDATPGDHAGGVVAANANFEGEVSDGDVALNVERHVGARVYARVAGPVTPAVRIENLQVTHRDPLVFGLSGQHRTLVEYDVVNSGNVRITSEARVEIESLLGLTLKRFDAHPVPELLPGNSVHITEAWENVSPLGPVTATVEVTGEGVTAKASERFFLIPWFWLAVAVALAVFFVLMRRRRRRRGRPVESVAAPPCGTDRRARRRMTRTAARNGGLVAIVVTLLLVLAGSPADAQDGTPIVVLDRASVAPGEVVRRERRQLAGERDDQPRGLRQPRHRRQYRLRSHRDDQHRRE